MDYIECNVCYGMYIWSLKKKKKRHRLYMYVNKLTVFYLADGHCLAFVGWLENTWKTFLYAVYLVFIEN